MGAIFHRMVLVVGRGAGYSQKDIIPRWSLCACSSFPGHTVDLPLRDDAKSG